MATKDEKQNRAPLPEQPAASSAPGVANTHIKTFHRGRLYLQLASIFAVVLAVTLGISVFFKVEQFTVTGNNRYSAWAVREASGIAEGENLLFFGRGGAMTRIRQQLPYVKYVRIGITLPGTVNIEIVEVSVVYALRDQAGAWWLVTADGVVTEKTDGATANENTVIQGVTLREPVAGAQAVAWEEPAQTDPTGESQIVAVTNADRLKTALDIALQLERNEILGAVASIDVSNLSDLQLWYGDRYQVRLGDIKRLDYKIAAVKSAIEQMGQFQTGVLDATFTVLKDQVGYTAFD